MKFALFITDRAAIFTEATAGTKSFYDIEHLTCVRGSSKTQTRNLQEFYEAF